MRIFIPNRKSTGRRGGNNRNIFIHDRFPNRTDIDISLFPSLFDKTIRNQRHPATFFFFQQPHPDPEGIHNLNEIFPQLRVIVIHITSMEITHLFRKSKLFFHLFLIPAFESSESIFRESTAMIDFQHSIQNRFYRFQSQRCIHNRRHRSGESPDQIGIRQNKIPYSRFLFTEFNPCRLDDISDLHIRRTGHFTPLAIDTIFQGLVIKTELLQTGVLRQDLPV